MDPPTIVLAVLLAAALVVCGWLLRERYRLLAARSLAEARLADQLATRETFRSLAGDALRSSNEEFVKLAKEAMTAKQTEAVAEMDKRREAVDHLLGPIQEQIKRTHEELQRAGRDRAGLREQIDHMTAANLSLRGETSKLSQALRKPNVRGRYGEVQLERVVELAGMRSYCDFTTQENLHDSEGNLQKPDIVVRLPNDRYIAIDAKTSIDAYMDALNAETVAEEDERLERYAENVMTQVQKLTKKKYWAHFDGSPDFVVMFIPGDQLVDAALERRPQLIEFAAENNIVIASPSTLIGLLRAVHVGWREKSLSDSAEELFELGRELHSRAAIALDKAAKIGTALDGARRHFNEFARSVQSRLVPTLRKFEERGARSPKTLTDLSTLEKTTVELPPLADPEVIVPTLPAVEESAVPKE